MQRIEVLDHGYLELVESWGSEERIIESARMSTGKGFLGWTHYRQCRNCNAVWDAKFAGFFGPCHGDAEHDWRDVPKGDAGLLEYLWTNKHSTPFEMAGLTIEVQAPIMVFREWHRHRVPFGYSEASARYIQLPKLFFVPTMDRLMSGSAKAHGSNKQAGTVAGAPLLTEENAAEFQRRSRQMAEDFIEFYDWALAVGVPKELARDNMPVCYYSRMRATGNLRGWLAFLTLRQAPNAQEEIRVYANAVAGLVQEHFPRTYELFAEGGLHVRGRRC